MVAITPSASSQSMPFNTTRPLNGNEYLESLQDGREIWLYGKRVDNVTTHRAFQNTARMIARLYDALHHPDSKPILTCSTDTGSGGYTHRFFQASHNAEEMVAARNAIIAWQRMVYGWIGRSPDYKAAFLGMLNVNADFYAPYQANARRWYKECQEKVLYLNHSLVNPPVDRHLPFDDVADVYVHVVKETDAGIIVSGAKVVATNAALTHYNFVGNVNAQGMKDPSMAISFIVAMNTPGVKIICRPSYEFSASMMHGPFDYPLSSRMDENDAIFILDNVLIPWENVFIYRDIDRLNDWMSHSGFLPRASLQGCTRLAVKLDFMTGLLAKAIETTGVDQFRGVHVNIGEVVAWRNLFWGLSDAMAHNVETLPNGTVLPNPEAATSYRVMMTIAYPRILEIMSNLVASGLIYQPSSALDFKTPELRPHLDKYVRGSNGVSAVERVKLMKLLWDSIGTEFAGRHTLYERNYFGSHEDVRMIAWFQGLESGAVDNMKRMVEQFMSEYDLDGWTVADLINSHGE